MPRDEKKILRDILKYFRTGQGDIQALYEELGREVDETEVTILLNNANIPNHYH